MADIGLLDQFAASLPPGETKTLAHVRDYAAWQTQHLPHGFGLVGQADDVTVRTYLAHLRAAGAGRAALRGHVAGLKRFYRWAKATGLTPTDPFEEFNFDRPLLSRDQIRKRQETFAGDAREREIGHLRALNRLADQLNRTLDLQTALEVTQATLAEMLHLKTTWIFWRAEAAPHTAQMHDFGVAAAHNLPPGLEASDRLYLCQGPDCHCQAMLRDGHMTRAVNVVECTRLQDSAEAHGDNQGLLFHASVPLTLEGQPAGIMNFATEDWQFLSGADLQLLSAAGALTSGALERARLYDQVRAGRARLELELEMARQVQASLLPNPLPDIPGFGLAAAWLAARETAGDFYDIFALPEADGRWVIVIGDVSDKGAPAALYMAMTRSLLRSLAESAPGPAALLRALNRSLMAHSSSEMFVTLFCALLDPLTGNLIYANAGHNPPVVQRAAGPMVELQPTGPLIGVFDEPEVAEKEIVLAEGDTLIAYTDGLTEAVSAAGEEYGPDRLRARLASSRETAQALLNRLLEDLDAFCQNVPQGDDVTVLILVRQ